MATNPAIQIIDVQTRLFDGIARVVLYPGFDLDTLTTSTTLAQVMAGAQDCGPIIEGSPSWDGEDTEIAVLRSTEGGIIRSKSTTGSAGFSCRVPHSAETAMVAGGKEYASATLGEGYTVATGKKVLGVDLEDMIKHCPVGVLNLTHNELCVFPKSTVTFSPTIDDDDLFQYNIAVQAESVGDHPNLATIMFVPFGADPTKAAAAASK